MGNEFSALMGRTAALAKGNKGDKEKIDVINKLIQAMHSSDPPNNKTRSAQVLNNKVVMRVLLDLSVGPSSDEVSTDALVALMQLIHDDENGKRLVQEHPELISALAAKMESSAGQVPKVVLWVLNNLSVNTKIRREMFVSNPKLVPQMMVAVKAYSDLVQADALAVLANFAYISDNQRPMFVNNPALVPLLMSMAESGTEQAQYEALRGLTNLTLDQENKREMVVHHPKLVPLMVAKVEFGTEQVRKQTLAMLSHLSTNKDNAAEMLSSCAPKLLPLLAGQVYEETMRNMHERTVMVTISMIYNLSLPAANRSVLLDYGNLVGVALTKGSRSGESYIATISILALVNVFGADSNAFQLNEHTLENVCDVLECTMLGGNPQIDNPLLAIRHLCVVENYRQMFWSVGGFQYTILDALEQAIQDKNISAMNDATLILARFTNDLKPLAWMRDNEPRLQRVFVQLGPFPEALSTAQTLLRAMEPPF